MNQVLDLKAYSLPEGYVGISHFVSQLQNRNMSSEDHLFLLVAWQENSNSCTCQMHYVEPVR